MAGSQRDTLNLRIKPHDRALIDHAASLVSKSPTDFVLEAARQASANVLLDRTVFVLKPRAFVRFLARVDMPSKPNKRLRRSLEAGMTIEEVMEEFDVTREQIKAVLEFAARSLDAPIPTHTPTSADARSL